MSEQSLGNRNKGGYFLAAVWLTWTSIAILSFARHYFEDTHLFSWPNGSWPDFLSWLACFYPWALLTPAIFRLEARLSLTRKEWKQNLGILLLASLIFSYLGSKIGTVLDFGVDRAFGKPASLSGFLWHLSPVVFVFDEFSFWSTLGAGCAIRHFAQFHSQARQAAHLALEKSRLEISLRQAELENLRMRLNPHFLFNTLQNVSVLTQQNPRLASQMLSQLGDLLRAALRRNVSSETTVGEEIALTRRYLAVEKIRFGDRLTVLVSVESGSDQALIPTFLLQPIVENAVIHGIQCASRAGTIAMRAAKQGDRLVLTITDDGVGLPDAWPGGLDPGIGLTSTTDRLSRMYPGEHEFVIRRLDEGGTEVRITIPFRRGDHSEEVVESEQPATVDC
ncbi:MAG: sensor histidine kinase [Terriglobales bacterium]